MDTKISKYRYGIKKTWGVMKEIIYENKKSSGTPYQNMFHGKVNIFDQKAIAKP